MSYNSLLLIPAYNVVSPSVTPAVPVGSPMVVQLQVGAALSSSESLYHPSLTQYFAQPPSALCQLSSALSPPHPASSQCLPHLHPIPIPAVIYASPLSGACIPVSQGSGTVTSAYVVGHGTGSPPRCPLCSSNLSKNRAKDGGSFKRRLQRLIGG